MQMDDFLHCIATTESGTRYEFRGSRVRRLPADEAEAELRRDHEWLRFALTDPPAVGKPMRLILEPLNVRASVTFRTTSLVTHVEFPED